MNSILRITDPIPNDDSIDKYEHFEYEPVVGTNLNNVGDIKINIETQDIFKHPSESFLLIEGRLTKADGTAYANADNISLTNNGIKYLFRDIRHELLGQEIEKINYLGQATTMLGLLKYPDDFSKSKGLINCGIRIQQPKQTIKTWVGILENCTLLIIPIQKDHLVLEFH